MVVFARSKINIGIVSWNNFLFSYISPISLFDLVFSQMIALNRPRTNISVMSKGVFIKSHKIIIKTSKTREESDLSTINHVQ